MKETLTADEWAYWKSMPQTRQLLADLILAKQQTLENMRNNNDIHSVCRYDGVALGLEQVIDYLTYNPKEGDKNA